MGGILDNPALGGDGTAFSWYPKGGYLGVAMRTPRWRFVRWVKPG